MLLVSIFVTLVRWAVACLPNARNAGQLLSGFRGMSAVEQAAFPSAT